MPAKRPLKDRVLDTVVRYGPTAAALAQLAVKVWWDVTHHGPVALATSPRHTI